MNESFCTYEWVMLRTFTAHMHDVTHTMWLPLQIRMSHVTHMKESNCTRSQHIWMDYVTHINESLYSYKWVTPYTWTSHVTHMNVLYHTYELVISHTRMSHVTQWISHITWYTYQTGGAALTHVADNLSMSANANEPSHMYKSCHTYESVTAHIQMSHVTHIHERKCKSPCTYN